MRTFDRARQTMVICVLGLLLVMEFIALAQEGVLSPANPLCNESSNVRDSGSQFRVNAVPHGVQPYRNDSESRYGGKPGLHL